MVLLLVKIDVGGVGDSFLLKSEGRKDDLIVQWLRH